MTDSSVTGTTELPPYRRMTYGEIHSPKYFNLKRLARELKLEKYVVRRPPACHAYQPEKVMLAVELVCNKVWPVNPGRTRPMVRFRQSLVGAIRTLSIEGYIGIGQMLGSTHSSAQYAYKLFMQRPEAERDEFIRKVRHELEIML